MSLVALSIGALRFPIIVSSYSTNVVFIPTLRLHVYHKLGISPCYDKINRTRISISYTGKEMLSASIPNVMGKLQRMQEEYPVDVTLYNTRMTKLTSLVNILQQTDILVIDVSDILLNMIF